MCTAVKKAAWKEVRDGISAYNPFLAEALDEVVGDSPGAPLFRVSYRYGRLIVDRGRFCSPCDPAYCDTCRELVASTQYSIIPLALIERQSAEVFLECQQTDSDDDWNAEDMRLIPLRLIGPGELFGTFEVLDMLLGTRDMRPNWSVSAGARSVWIIAPLGDARIGKWVWEKTRTRWSEEKAPHWRLVEALQGDKWTMDVVVFPEEIMRAATRSHRFYRTLLESGWRQSANLRHGSITDFSVWETFNKTAAKHPLGELYHYATVRHLMGIASGDVPGFQPSHRAPINAGPFEKVESALAQFLPTINREFARYSPVILQPAHLGLDGDIAYYSFRCPSLPAPRLGKPPKWSEVPATMADTLKSFRKDRNAMLDFKQTTFFARTGEYSLEANKDLLPTGELLPSRQNGTGAAELFLNSPFFVAGCRIVRNGASEVRTTMTAGN